ncbi:MAG: sulfatase-like hydrolase/transferase [Thermoanaerobaculia bacterium]|nr:sulfatase-like hydrolase/transferase [Thermoanaerobaculia bacterium]
MILISIDTLRADRLPMFGYRGVATPHLDAFRGDAILFTSAFSHVPLTLPSHASMLSGQLPAEHKVRNNLGYVLGADVATLPALLKSRGYETGAAVSAYVLRGSTGLSRSFDFYEDSISNRGGAAAGQLQRSGRVTARIATQWIAPRAAKPFFFMLHIFEPHSPYEPEAPFRAVASPYDGEVATADAIVGSFLDDLKSRGVYDRAIIIIASDHGEGLGDHGEPEHGIFVYREAIHVPLLVKLPHSAMGGETVDAPVGLSDIAPTIAQLTDLRAPASWTGRSLLGPRQDGRRIYSESLYGRIHLGWSELRSLADSRFHFIEAPRAELYDMKGDPAEKRNVLAEERRVYAAMREELGRFNSAAVLPSAIDPEEAKKLAALGYLSSTPQAARGPLPDPKDRIGEIAAMVRATTLLHERRLPEAISAFREIVRSNPRLSDGWNQLGSALESAGRYEEASEVYRSAIEVAPELAPELGLKRGSLLLRMEKFAEAERHARLASRTNNAGMHLLLARIHLARKEFGPAEEEARLASADASNRIGAELLLAQIYSQQNRLREAAQLVASVEKQIAREGIGPVETFEYVRGDVLARMERYDEAIAAFDREIKAFPQHRQPYANLYLVYMVLNRRADAERALDAMVSATPTREAALFAARSAEALGDSPLALRWRDRAQKMGKT